MKNILERGKDGIQLNSQSKTRWAELSKASKKEFGGIHIWCFGRRERILKNI